MTKLEYSTNVDLENGNPAFAKPVLGAVPFTIVHLEDCNKALKRFDDNYFDVAIVDPPYGIGEDGGKARTRGSKISTNES